MQVVQVPVLLSDDQVHKAILIKVHEMGGYLAAQVDHSPRTIGHVRLCQLEFSHGARCDVRVGMHPPLKIADVHVLVTIAVQVGEGRVHGGADPARTQVHVVVRHHFESWLRWRAHIRKQHQFADVVSRWVEVAVVGHHQVHQSIAVVVESDRVRALAHLDHPALEKILLLEFEVRSTIASGVLEVPDPFIVLGQ